jgi:hypothetical protein
MTLERSAHRAEGEAEWAGFAGRDPMTSIGPGPSPRAERAVVQVGWETW